MDESPIYLHEVGDFLSAKINFGRNSSQQLQRIFSSKVQAIFEQPVDEMRPEYNEMSLYRFAQIVNAMNPSRQLRKVLDFGNELIAREDEPKPIISVYRLLQKITTNGQIVFWTGKT